jgi:hypothetical protein
LREIKPNMTLKTFKYYRWNWTTVTKCQGLISKHMIRTYSRWMKQGLLLHHLSNSMKHGRIQIRELRSWVLRQYKTYCSLVSITQSNMIIEYLKRRDVWHNKLYSKIYIKLTMLALKRKRVRYSKYQVKLQRYKYTSLKVQVKVKPAFLTR